MSLLSVTANFNSVYNYFRIPSQFVEATRDADNNPTPPNSARRVHLIFQVVIISFDIIRTSLKFVPISRVPFLLSELGARVVNLGIGAHLLARGHRDPLLKTNIVVNALNITKLALITFATIKLLPIALPLSVGIAALNSCDFVFRANAWINYHNNAIYA